MNVETARKGCFHAVKRTFDPSDLHDASREVRQWLAKGHDFGHRSRGTTQGLLGMVVDSTDPCQRVAEVFLHEIMVIRGC